MQIDGWKYYNYAIVPSTPPHVDVNEEPIRDSRIWNINKKAMLVRWITNWDCKEETNWWYIIKDEPFDIDGIKSKRRYEIKKGIKNFKVKLINPVDYAEQIYEVANAAYQTYPKSYRPNITKSAFIENVKRWGFYKVYGAFLDESPNILCGYACLTKENNYIDFCVLKARPDKEKLGLNAAIVYAILTDNEDFLASGGYICDGSRSVQHETAFQDYLQKYFGFRKAFCDLNIVYRPWFQILINILYSRKWLVKKLSWIAIMRKLGALVKLEEINRAR